AIADAPSIGSIGVVVPEAVRNALEGDLLAVPKVVAVVAGGPSRQGSLVLGLASVARVAAAGVVVVHDAARPLVTPGIVEEVVGAVAGEFDGAIAAIPLDDAVKEVGDTGWGGTRRPRLRPHLAVCPRRGAHRRSTGPGGVVRCRRPLPRHRRRPPRRWRTRRPRASLPEGCGAGGGVEPGSAERGRPP